MKSISTLAKVLGFFRNRGHLTSQVAPIRAETTMLFTTSPHQRTTRTKLLLLQYGLLPLLGILLLTSPAPCQPDARNASYYVLQHAMRSNNENALKFQWFYGELSRRASRYKADPFSRLQVGFGTVRYRTMEEALRADADRLIQRAENLSGADVFGWSFSLGLSLGIPGIGGVSISGSPTLRLDDYSWRAQSLDVEKTLRKFILDYSVGSDTEKDIYRQAVLRWLKKDLRSNLALDPAYTEMTRDATRSTKSSRRADAVQHVGRVVKFRGELAKLRHDLRVQQIRATEYTIRLEAIRREGAELSATLGILRGIAELTQDRELARFFDSTQQIADLAFKGYDAYVSGATFMAGNYYVAAAVVLVTMMRQAQQDAEAAFQENLQRWFKEIINQIEELRLELRDYYRLLDSHMAAYYDSLNFQLNLIRFDVASLDASLRAAEGRLRDAVAHVEKEMFYNYSQLQRDRLSNCIDLVSNSLRPSLTKSTFDQCFDSYLSHGRDQSVSRPFYHLPAGDPITPDAAPIPYSRARQAIARELNLVADIKPRLPYSSTSTPSTMTKLPESSPNPMVWAANSFGLSNLVNSFPQLGYNKRTLEALRQLMAVGKAADELEAGLWWNETTRSFSSDRFMHLLAVSYQELDALQPAKDSVRNTTRWGFDPFGTIDQAYSHQSHDFTNTNLGLCDNAQYILSPGIKRENVDVQIHPKLSRNPNDESYWKRLRLDETFGAASLNSFKGSLAAATRRVRKDFPPVAFDKVPGWAKNVARLDNYSTLSGCISELQLSNWRVLAPYIDAGVTVSGVDVTVTIDIKYIWNEEKNRADPPKIKSVVVSRQRKTIKLFGGVGASLHELNYAMEAVPDVIW